MTVDERGTLHFTEVKAWASQRIVHPLETLGPRRLQKLRDLMRHFAADWEAATEQDRTPPERSLPIARTLCDGETSLNLAWVRGTAVEIFWDLMRP